MPPNNLYNTPTASLQPMPTVLPPAVDKSKKRLIISLVVTGLLLIGVLVFALWSYSRMKDYKNHSDQKVAIAVQNATNIQKQQLETQFANQAKLPYKNYVAPSQYGSVKITYPKTWSAYIAQNINNNNLPVDAYFYPDYVPDLNGNNNYYLRVQISGSSYSSILNQYSTQINQGVLRATPFIPTLVPKASPGVRLDGQFSQGIDGSMIIIPVRNVVLCIWTDNANAINDFNNVINSLTFSP